MANEAEASTSTPVTARALVRVVIAVEIQGSWGEDCSLGQVTKQATDAATAILRHPENFGNAIKARRVSIAGPIEVDRILIPKS